MKRTRKYIEFGVNSKHKERTTISTIIYYPHEKQKMHFNQILTILIFIPDKHAKYQYNGTFHKKHLFGTRQNNNKKARKLGQIKTLLS